MPFQRSAILRLMTSTESRGDMSGSGNEGHMAHLSDQMNHEEPSSMRLGIDALLLMLIPQHERPKVAARGP